MNIINLTPHTLNIHTGTTTLDVDPSGTVARVAMTETELPSVGGIPVVSTSYGEVENLPAPKEGTIYVVSGMVEAQTSRPDVYAPGPLVRNEEGRPVGCKGLKQT